jgi:hypothetical protein
MTILMNYDHIGFPMQYGLFQLAAQQILFTDIFSPAYFPNDDENSTNINKAV